jgi:3-oxoacyl-[acyl-carrier protein] reductase
MSGKLSGKIAIVTGSSKGIGAEIAKELAKQGASVVVNYSSSKNDADRVVNEIKAQKGKAIAIKADLSNTNEIKPLFDETIKQFGQLDILVNNAGFYKYAPLEEVTAEDFHKMYNINVLGLLFASKEAAKHLSKSGSIINIGSVVTKHLPPHSSIYAGTKSAVEAITKVLSKELGPKKIRVNAVNPGLVETEGVHTQGFMGSDLQKQYEKQSSLGRIGVPKDIAPTVAFLASEDASWITGEIFVVSGGI